MSNLNNQQNSISNAPLDPKTPSKWVFMDTTPALSSKIVKKYTTFYKYLLFVYSYSTLTRIYGMENITTEEVMDKLDILKSRFGKVDEFGWWDLE